jgi:hypothetical protein
LGKKLLDGKGTVTIDFDEFTVNFKVNADIEDGVVMNIQLNHDWDGKTPIKPHLHWFQNQNETPNWLIGYRWHQNGQTKVTVWTYSKVVSNSFPYSSGTILQISNFGEIFPPSNPTEISSIPQLKLMRDAGKSEYNTNDNFIDLSLLNAAYSVNIPAGLNGTGRFYLHAGNQSSSGKWSNISSDLRIYSAQKELIVEGGVSPMAKLQIIDLLGRTRRIVSLEEAYRNSINIADLKQGIYLVLIEEEMKVTSKKVFIE